MSVGDLLDTHYFLAEDEYDDEIGEDVFTSSDCHPLHHVQSCPGVFNL